MKENPTAGESVVSLEVDGRPITASVHGSGGCVVIFGPGAGGTRQTPQLLAVARALDPARFRILLFNFPYQEARRRFPDPAALLERTVAQVAGLARQTWEVSRMVLGGRSMGGRMASQAVANGLDCDGLAFLAYPLHPPNQETRLRDAHLSRIAQPMLFLQGTRDAFARLDLIEATVGRLGPRAELSLLEAADHSFKTPRGAASTSRQTEAEVIVRLSSWLGQFTDR